MIGGMKVYTELSVLAVQLIFSQPLTITASWDKKLMLDVATTISDEAHAKHHEFVRREKRGMYQG